MKAIKKYSWFLKENDGWKKIFTQQKSEMPKMEEILENVSEFEEISLIERDAINQHFGSELIKLQLEIQKLSDLI